MAILHVRNVPDKLHARLRRLAAERKSSLSAEVIHLLDKATRRQEERERVRRLLAGLRRHRFIPPKGAPDSVALLREDRGR